MFIFSKNDDLGDPNTMSVKEIATKILEVVDDPAFYKAMDDFVVTDKQTQKALETFEAIIMASPGVTKLDANTVRGFRAGIAYGIGLASKLTVDASDIANLDKKSVIKKMKTFAFMFKALEQGAGVWEDTKWYENLMKNVKLTTEEVTAEKNANSGDTKVRRDQKKGAV